MVRDSTRNLERKNAVETFAGWALLPMDPQENVMTSRKLICAAALALLPAATALAGSQMSGKDTDETASAIAALKKSLPSSFGFEVDKVKVTSSGVACIDYHLDSTQGGTKVAHAVVKGDEVTRSTLGNARFEKEWEDNCYGSRGGNESR